jgi:hypothetical protein
MRAFLGALSAAALLIGGAAQATPLPGLTNLEFLQYTGTAPKASFTSVAPVGWTGGSGLIFIDSQTPFMQTAAGSVYLTTYANPTGFLSGNYVEADGNPEFSSGFNYTVTGLTPGDTYTLSFSQGASEQTGFASPTIGQTTNRWIVSLGTAGLSVNLNDGPIDAVYGQTSTYYNSDATASIAASPLMTVPNGTAVGWDYVSVNLTADSTTDILSFLAWGDDGSTVNLPPIAFLGGVDTPAPEPYVWALLAVGLAGVGVVVRRRLALRKRLPLPA